MFSNELQNYLLKDKFSRKIYCGVIPIDKLHARRIKKPCAFIVNNQESDKQGEHWFAIFIPRYDKAEYFDSYGLPPIDERVLKFFKLNCDGYIYNSSQLQSDQSENCGKYCIFYIYFRSRNFSMKKIIKFFSFDVENNDSIIERFFKRIKF